MMEAAPGTRDFQRGLRNLVVGLGRSGVSCVRRLLALGEAVAAVDSRAQPPGLAELRREFPHLEIRTGGLDPDLFASAQRLLLSPGVAMATPEVAAAFRRGVPVWGDIELFARLARAPVAAITGSNGKSTVTTMLAAMADSSGIDAVAGGNLGTPALELLDRDPAVYLLELSSFQLETTFSLDAAAATVLNVSADHMDRYATLGEYIAAKARIYRGSGVQIINFDDPVVRAMLRPGRRVIGFGEGPGEQDRYGLQTTASGVWLSRGGCPLMSVTELPVAGRHNCLNALAALAMGEALGWPMEGMLAGLRRYRGLPHRGELVARIDGVSYVNDSKGTNVGAALAAVQGADAPLVLIAGGLAKDQDFGALGEALRGRARAVVLLGRDRELLRAALPAGLPAKDAADMEEAVGVARSLARAGDMVLLSPACASFDMFDGFEARGEAFRAAVEGLRHD